MADVKNKQVNIYIDQSAAETALNRLQNTADKLNKKIDEGRAAGKNMAAELKKLDEVNGSIKKVQDQVDKGLKPSITQQTNLVRQLNNELKRMSQSDPDFAKKTAEFQKQTRVLAEMKGAITSVEAAQKNSSFFSGVFWANLGANIVNNFINRISFTGIIAQNAKLSDSLSDIEKATGLTTSQVQDLNNQLNKLDTRTSAEDLRDIAVGLGQIGQAATAENVAAIDKIVVALGDEFGGGAKEITTTLSILRNNLQDIKTGNYGEDVAHIGNALNVLGAEGLATAPVVTDFANRMAGIAGTFKLSSGEILGVSAAMQELGINVERGSTAFTKVLQKIAAEPAKFAEVAGLSVKEFTNLVNKDMLAAFNAVAVGAGKASGTNTVFASILKELDTDGSGAGEVLSKLAKNQELLAGKVTLASAALKEETSITEEFNKKNTNLAAELDKLQKSLSSLLQSQSLTDFFTSVVRGINNFVNALKAAPQWLKENQTGIYLIITGIALMNASYIKAGLLIAKDTALRIYNTAVTKATAIATDIATASQAAYIIVTNLLTGKISLATAAVRLFNTAMSLGAGTIGIIVVAIGALVIGINALVSGTSKLTAEQRINLQLQDRISSSSVEETEKIKQLTSVINDNTVSHEAKKKALDELIKINPEYLNGLTLENLKTAEGKSILDGYVNSLTKKAEAEAKSSLLTDKIKERDKSIAQLKTDSRFKDLSSDQIQQVAEGNEIPGAVHLYGDFKNRNVAGVDLNALRDNLAEIKILQKDLSDFTKDQIESTLKAQQDGNNQTVQSSATTLAILKKQLKDLQDERDNIDINDKAKLSENAKAQQAIQKQIDALGFDSSKKSAKSLDDARKSFQSFIKGLDDDFAKSQIPNSLQQLAAAAKKYFDDLKALQEGFSKGFINADEYKKKAAEIEAIYKDSVHDLTKEQAPKIDIVPQVQEEDFNKVLADAKEFLRKLTANNKAGLDLDILNAKNPKEHRDAVLAELNWQKQQDLNNTKLTANERALIEAQYREKEGQAWTEYYQMIAAQVGQVLEFASQAVGILDQFIKAKENRENAELQKELARNDKLKSAYQAQLNGKLITQNEYNLKVAALDAASDKKKAALEAKQFERQKKIQIAQALINGAEGVTKDLASYPMPWALIPIALTVAATAAQIAVITSQKPASSSYGKGGKLTGPGHSDGGMPVINPITGVKEAEVEGGEYILSKDTVKNNRRLADALLQSSMYNGGATIEPGYFTRSYKPVAAHSIMQTYQTMKFAAGGILPAGTPVSGDSNLPTTDPVLLETLQQSQAINIQLAQTVSNLQQQLSKPIQSYVSLKQLNDTSDQKQRILKDATFNR